MSSLHERLAVLQSVDVLSDPVFERTTSLAQSSDFSKDVDFIRSNSAPSLLEGQLEKV